MKAKPGAQVEAGEKLVVLSERHEGLDELWQAGCYCCGGGGGGGGENNLSRTWPWLSLPMQHSTRRPCQPCPYAPLAPNARIGMRIKQHLSHSRHMKHLRSNPTNVARRWAHPALAPCSTWRC